MYLSCDLSAIKLCQTHQSIVVTKCISKAISGSSAQGRDVGRDVDDYILRA